MWYWLYLGTQFYPTCTSYFIQNMTSDLQVFGRKISHPGCFRWLGHAVQQGCFFSLLTLFLILAPSPVMQQGICSRGKLHGKFQPGQITKATITWEKIHSGMLDWNFSTSIYGRGRIFSPCKWAEYFHANNRNIVARAEISNNS